MMMPKTLKSFFYPYLKISYSSNVKNLRNNLIGKLKLSKHYDWRTNKTYHIYIIHLKHMISLYIPCIFSKYT